MTLYNRKHCTGQKFDFAQTEFTEFEICYIAYILTIGTENDDFYLTSGVRCVAIGLYMISEGCESHRVLFLKLDSFENFRHSTNATMRLIFSYSKCCLLRIKALSNSALCQ